MKYTPEIEKLILNQIATTPDAPIILPPHCYWKGVATPWIYVDQMPVRLVNVLYELAIGPIPPGASIGRRVGTMPADVNPHHWEVVPVRIRAARSHCPKDHPYTQDDWFEGVGHRCQTCRAERLLGTPSVADINREKTHCPKNHILVKRKNGRRMCKECPKERSAAWRAKQKETQGK